MPDDEPDEEPWFCAVHGPVEGPAHFRFLHENAWEHVALPWLHEASEAEADVLQAQQAMYLVASWHLAIAERQAEHDALLAQIRDCPIHGAVRDYEHYYVAHLDHWTSVFGVPMPINVDLEQRHWVQVRQDLELVLKVRDCVATGRRPPPSVSLEPVWRYREPGAPFEFPTY